MGKKLKILASSGALVILVNLLGPTLGLDPAKIKAISEVLTALGLGGATLHAATDIQHIRSSGANGVKLWGDKMAMDSIGKDSTKYLADSLKKKPSESIGAD